VAAAVSLVSLALAGYFWRTRGAAAVRGGGGGGGNDGLNAEARPLLEPLLQQSDLREVAIAPRSMASLN
jgi:hypothetical protein